MKLSDLFIAILCIALFISIITLFTGLYKRTQYYCSIPAAAYSQDAAKFCWDELWQEEYNPYEQE